MLERFAKDIWPGWTNYLDPEFRVQFPNLVFLIVGPRAAVPDGYLLAEGRTVHGKPVYLNRKEELPIALQPPLGGGGGGGLTIRIRLQQFPLRPGVTPPENAVKGDKPFEPRYDVSEQQILAYVHEFFHGFQAVAIPGRAPTPQPRAPRAAEQPPAPPPTPMRSAPRDHTSSSRSITRRIRTWRRSRSRRPTWPRTLRRRASGWPTTWWRAI
ncbi:MAG: hypothetical protein EHM13_08820 [Acidobacteria bacterium]|nr:MAG: hypothetical protein EHM13_08820 [Acidobacteriota bacterium]